MKVYLILAMLAAMAGCASPLDEPLPISKSKRHVEKVKESDVKDRFKNGMNCELKNGPTGCTLTNGMPVGSKLRPEEQKAAYEMIGECRVAVRLPSDSDRDWQRRFQPGRDCLRRERKKHLKIAAELRAQVEAERRLEASRASSDDDVSGSEDTGGTWYCSTLDGSSGAYGTYRMRENPDMDPSTCKKVSN